MVSDCGCQLCMQLFHSWGLTEPRTPCVQGQHHTPRQAIVSALFHYSFLRQCVAKLPRLALNLLCCPGSHEPSVLLSARSSWDYRTVPLWSALSKQFVICPLSYLAKIIKWPARALVWWWCLMPLKFSTASGEVEVSFIMVGTE